MALVRLLDQPKIQIILVNNLRVDLYHTLFRLQMKMDHFQRNFKHKQRDWDILNLHYFHEFLLIHLLLEHILNIKYLNFIIIFNYQFFHLLIHNHLQNYHYSIYTLFVVMRVIPNLKHWEMSAWSKRNL